MSRGLYRGDLRRTRPITVKAGERVRSVGGSPETLRERCIPPVRCAEHSAFSVRCAAVTGVV
ncbi:hypothetical protein ACFYWY_36895 [Streptomyces sp. NPDC002870]|uniref:hypothetical protein n=1 Tax=Streptomyces sp. NPDC002870 TaxID=3364666 RepID=UPI00369A2FA3